MSDVDPRLSAAPTLFFVVGAQKSGTTWLQHYFAEHPEVCVPAAKETNYWQSLDKGHDATDAAMKRRVQRRYGLTPWRMVRRALNPRLWFPDDRDRSMIKVVRANQNPGPPHHLYADLLFDGCADGVKAVGEVCPQYSGLSIETYKKMLLLNPNTKFIFVMRDPLSRTISAIRHGLRIRVGGGKNYNAAQLAEAVNQALSSGSGWGFGRSDYTVTLAALDAAVPADRVLTIFYEDMFSQSAISRLNEFLEISETPVDFGKRVHSDTQQDVSVSPADEHRLLVKLADEYFALRDRFKSSLPAVWQTRIAALTEGSEIIV